MPRKDTGRRHKPKTDKRYIKKKLPGKGVFRPRQLVIANNQDANNYVKCQFVGSPAWLHMADA